jgi:flagellar P-ring protein precursor FlgI
MGEDVHIAPVAILHGTLTVEIETILNASHPEALSSGQTTVTPQTTVTEEKAWNVVLKQGASVEELVRALKPSGPRPVTS